MKTLFLLVLLIALVGCTSDKPHTATLTPGQATDLAQTLANDKAQALYKCRSFSNGPSAQLVEGYWVWQDRRGQGQTDLEATVRFARDGANPNVNLVLLDGRPTLPKEPR